MGKTDLEKYCTIGKEHGATGAKVIHPNTVVTAAWVKWKCRYGCPDYDVRHTCPPETPSYQETRAVLDCYKRAILFHQEQLATPERGKLGRAFLDSLLEDHIAGKEIVKKVSMAKAWICEMANRVAYDCVQLHGGYGYMDEYPISRFARDVRVFPIFAGTTEVMKVIIGRMMGL